MKRKYVLFTLLVLVSFFSPKAQIGLQTYIETGKNYISDGQFLKTALTGDYRMKEYHFESGLQFDIISYNPIIVSGFNFEAGRNTLIKGFPVDFKAFFLLNRYSDLLYETNWGFRAGTKKFAHWNLELGSNSKSYIVNYKIRHDYGLENKRNTLTEAIDLTYLVTFFLNPHESNWNVGLSVTNVDNFTINHSTNPYFNLLVHYKPNPNLSINISSWYSQAAIFNIYSSYFGYHLRGGVRWEI